MSDKSKECEELRRQVIDLATTSEYLQLQLEKPSLVPSPKRVDIHVQTDKPPAPLPTPEPPAKPTTSSASVQTDPNVETKPSNGLHLHLEEHNEKPTTMKTLETQLESPAETKGTVISPSTEFADDIALLTDPNVLLEEELIKMKEQCLKLADANHQLEKRLGKSTSTTDSIGNRTPTVWIVAPLIAIIAYLLVSQHF